jgi:hypothetical protein
MVTLFDATRPVKSARPFGLGIVTGHVAFEPSAADR